MVKPIWLDCDPGHDDATAILLALNSPEIKLLGVSTVHGNSDADCTFRNAIRCLHAFGAPPDLVVNRGAGSPLIRAARHDSQIHGPDGLGGVQGLPPADHPSVLDRLTHSLAAPRAIEAMARCIKEVCSTNQKPGGTNEFGYKSEKITIVSMGPMTNIALFISVYPELLNYVDRFVFMGGGVGRGNRSAVAEFNVLCDPEAAQIVLNAPVEKVMIPLNVTHTAIVTSEIHNRLLSPSAAIPSSDEEPAPKPRARTPLRHTLSTLINFFAERYRAAFRFTTGPPLHDALTIAYIVHPELFVCQRFHVDVELSGTHTSGETVVDVWDYKQSDGQSWGRNGKNCLVAESLDVSKFFDFFLDCVERCDAISPLNKTGTQENT